MITARQRPDLEAFNQRKQQTYLAFLERKKCETPDSSQNDSAANTR
jgi:hypothetical protein